MRLGAASLKPSAGDFAIGPQRPAPLKFVLAEDFSILIYGPRRFRLERGRIVLLH